MAMLLQLLDYFLHVDKYLDVITSNYGAWTYGILFLVIFCETGLVATPFLPGDSLLFAAGALCARGSGLEVNLVAGLIFVAAFLGDTVNYHVGQLFGEKLMQRKNSMIFRPEYLKKTSVFFERYGKMTLIMARFVPIVRTFAPFMSGLGKMNYGQFLVFNLTGGFLWTGLFVYGGFLFGETELVRKNFSLVILAIIVVSIMPMVVEFIRQKCRNRQEFSA